MLEVYKRVDKTLDNPYGAVSIQNLEQLNKPFLLCLSAQDMNPKSIFGIIKEGARAARVYTTDETAAGFKIDEFPIDFLGVKFTRDNSYKNNYEEIADKLIYPFLTNNNTLTSIEDIKKRARMINIMSYCDGTLTYGRIEQRIKIRLQNDGYSKDDIDDILSQISLVAIGTMVDVSKISATTSCFIDVNDTEIYTNRTNSYQKLLHDENKRCLYGHLGKTNNVMYLFEGSGKHSLKEYFLDSSIVKPAISSVISKYIQNSLANLHGDTLIRISLNDALEQLRVFGDDSKDPQELLSKLDNSLSYDSATRYTPEEAIMKHELDSSYAEILKTKTELERIKNERDAKDRSLKSVIDGIREFSSETTLYQILSAARLWQLPAGKDITQEKSDKVIREEYEQLLDSLKPNAGPKL